MSSRESKSPGRNRSRKKSTTLPSGKIATTLGQKKGSTTLPNRALPSFLLGKGALHLSVQDLKKPVELTCLKPEFADRVAKAFEDIAFGVRTGSMKHKSGCISILFKGDGKIEVTADLVIEPVKH